MLLDITAEKFTVLHRVGSKPGHGSFLLACCERWADQSSVTVDEIMQEDPIGRAAGRVTISCHWSI